MRNTIIEAFDLPSCWYKIIQEIMTTGYIRPVFRGMEKGQKRRELDSVTIHVSNPGNKPIIPDVPASVPPPTNMKYVYQYLGYLVTPLKQIGEEYSYGERIAGMRHIDRIEGTRLSGIDFNQLDMITKYLKETPETNRGFCLIGQAQDLLLEHPPCLQYMQMKVRYDALHMWVVFRSWDAWGGLPNNLAGLELVKQSKAGELGVKNGEIFAFSAGLHLYETAWDLANQCLRHSTGGPRFAGAKMEGSEEGTT